MKRNPLLPGLLLAAGSWGLALVGMVLVGTVWAAPLLADSAPVSLATDVAPIMTQRCVMCHIAGAAQGGLDLYTNLWGAIVNVKSTQSSLNLVEPGDLDKSYLYLKLTGAQLSAGGSGAQMPFQAGQLDAGQLELIRSWIAQGAPNN
ncbi:MAG: hypothetical protein EXR85_00440 [Xanthomonadales bacterium]|nr:hypothetical protein [Xanthomonadales bacterium]